MKDVQLEGSGKWLEIPEQMVQQFMIELKQVTQPGEREALEEVREMTGLVLDTLAAEPELMDFKEYQDDYIKAMAMRAALARYGILYDA